MKLHRGACQVVTLLGLTVISTFLASRADAIEAVPQGKSTVKKKTTKSVTAKKVVSTPPKPQSTAQSKAQPQVKPQPKPQPKSQAKVPVKAPVKRRPSPPPPVFASLPMVTGQESVSEGCADSSNLHDVASRIGVDETKLTSLLADRNVDLREGNPCLRFVALTGGQDGAASAAFQPVNDVNGSAPAIVIQNTLAGVTAVTDAAQVSEPDTRVLVSPVDEVGDPQGAFMAMIPASLRWELETIGKEMIDPLRVHGESGAETPYSARIEIGKHGDAGTEYLRSIEIMEADTGHLVDGAWWVERTDGPGAFIDMRGDSYERLLWQSPVIYKRFSRGVGQAVTTFYRTVARSKSSTTGRPVVRTTQIRGFHGGDDLAAPMGSEVHAVGNATVSFAGRRGDFGKLVILDHGLGYQTYYAHLSAIDPEMKEGATVVRGETVGRVGSTGRSTGPHLHFETRKDGKYIDSFDDTKDLEFWVLSAEDQQRLALRLLSSMPTPAVSLAEIPKF